MQLLSLLAIGGLTASVAGRSMQSVGKREEAPRPRVARPHPSRNMQSVKRETTSIINTEASKSKESHLVKFS
jgi:carboxypeptidase D